MEEEAEDLLCFGDTIARDATVLWFATAKSGEISTVVLL